MRRSIKIFQDEKYIITILFICAFSIFFISSLPIGMIFGADEAATVFPAKIAEEYGEFVYVDDFNQKYDTYWFRMPGYLANSKGELYPHGFIGTKILFTPLYLLIGDVATNVFNSFFGGLSVVYLYLLTKLIFQDKLTATAISIFFFFSPFIWIQSTYIFPELTVICILLAFVYYLLRYKMDEDKRYLVISSLLLSIGILIKFFNILMLIPALWYLKRGKVIRYNSVFIALLIPLGV